jgi:hypothetical protein
MVYLISPVLRLTNIQLQGQCINITVRAYQLLMHPSKPLCFLRSLNHIASCFFKVVAFATS